MNVREALDDIYKEFEKSYEEAKKEGYAEGLDENIKEAYENGANDAWELAYKLEESPFDFYDGIERKDIWGYIDVEDIIKQLTGAQALADLKEYEAKQKVVKVGDRVRTLVDKDNMGTERFPVGTIGEVTDYDGVSIEVSVDGKRWFYNKKDIELANDVILVGDEVYLLDANYHGVVTAVWEDCGVVKTESLTQSGKLACDDAKDLHRTGRRFPEIVNVLKQMQEGGT